MSKIKKIATLSFGQGINIIVNFLFLPYMARVLSYEEYGSYGQVLLITTFLASLLSFGLPQIIYVYLSNDQENDANILSSNISATIILGCFGIFFLIISAPYFASWFKNPSLTELIIVYSCSLIFILPYQSINSYFIFHNKIKLSTLLVISTNLLKVTLVVLAIQLYNSIYLALVGILTSQFIQLLVCIYSIKQSLTFQLKKVYILSQLKKGFPLGLTGIIGAGILYIDGIMVSKIEGTQAFAIYRNGAIEVPFIATLYASIAAIILPEVAKLYSNNLFNEILQLKRKVIMNTMMLTYPILVFLLFNSHELIIIYLGVKYEASTIIFAIFNLTLLFRVTNYSDILIAANKSKHIFFYYSLTFSINMLLNYFFINWLGSMGAAISTVFSIGLLAYLQINKSLNLISATFKQLVNWKEFTILIFITLLLAGVIEYILTYLFQVRFKLILFSIFYFPIIYLYLLKFNFFSPEIINILPLKKFFKKNQWD